MPRYTIHCAGFEQVQLASMGAIFDLAHSALSHSWSITESHDSDVVMINMQEENAQQLLAEYDKLADYRVILVADNSQDSFQNYWFLEKKQHAPPSLRVLVDLLNQVAICLDEAEVNQPQKESVELEQKNEVDDMPAIQVQEEEPEVLEVLESNASQNSVIADIEHPQRKLIDKNYLFGFLVQASKDKKYRIIKLKSLPDLYLSPEEGHYYFSGTDGELLQYCFAEPQSLIFNILSRAKFNKALKAVMDKPEPQDLKYLVSYAIVKASNGQLLDGHTASQQLILRNMPDVEGNSVLSDYTGVAEYMYQQEVNLFDVAEKLKVSISDVFDIYNVCYLLGYVKLTTASGKDEKSANSQTLGRFLKSFFTK